jgi:hypothetical protein
MAPPSSESLEEAPSGRLRPARARPRQHRLGEASHPKTVAAASATILLLFIASLLVPASFEVAGIKFTPYRILLIPLCVPLFLHFVRDREHPVNAVDVLFMGYIFWAAAAILYNHGVSRIPWIAGTAIDEFGAYLVGRTLIRNASDYRLFFKYFYWGLVFLLPFAVVELLTRWNILFDVVGLIATPTQTAGQPPRLGLNRVQSVFAHSILFGVFCSVGIANLFYIHRDRFLRRWSRTGLACLMTFMSLSSAPNLAMAIQFVLMLWERISCFLPGRWVVLGGGTAVVLAILQLAHPSGVLGLLINNATFDPQTGWGRTEILKYGTAEILRHPIFGIGFDEWTRPFWKKASVDNFWIATGMRLGLPTALLFFAALMLHCALIAFRRGLNDEAMQYRTGYLISWVGVFFSLWTVAVFSALTPFLMAYLGAGAWFYAGRNGTGKFERLGAVARKRAAERRADTKPDAEPSSAGLLG